MAVIVLLAGILTTVSASAVSPPKKGDPFPEIGFPVPKDGEHREYLGLRETGKFTLAQIKAKVVIIEIFNMY